MDLNPLVLDYLTENKDATMMITWFFNEVIDEKAEIQVKALPYERTEEINGCLSGYWTRS